MNKTIVSKIWKNRKALINTVTAGVIIGKGISDFARKDKLSKVLALGELGIGVMAAIINSGIDNKAISIVAERKAAADYDRYPPDLDEDGFDPNEFDDFINSGESPDVYDDEDYEEDSEDYTPDIEDKDDSDTEE